tara:strand:- start:63 stop:815 length:753 start_codon:yes stop_codon:yes gene_type:complete
MKKIREVKISKITELSKNFKIVTFTGDELHDFPTLKDGGYIKLLFSEKPLDCNYQFVRPFTIKYFSREKLELEVLFTNLQSSIGLASKWAQKIKIKDKILISGPGHNKPLLWSSKWYLFIGDFTALAAISVYLKNINKKSKGLAIIEVKSKEDIIELEKPYDFEIKWILSSKVKNFSQYKNNLENLKWLNEQPCVWAACEFELMKKLRNFLIKDKKILKENVFISSYWKKGLDQEEHKIVKKKDLQKWEN